MSWAFTFITPDTREVEMWSGSVNFAFIVLSRAYLAIEYDHDEQGLF